MIFLGTLNQANTRNWATAVVRHADIYTLLNVSLLFCNLFFPCHFLCLQIVSSSALERSSSLVPLHNGMVGDRTMAEKPEEKLLLTYL